jgi:hypothetical protein
MRRLIQIQILALMSVIAFCTAYAYASSERPSPGGEGVSAISGWNVSNIQYHLADGPSKTASVEFDLDGPAATVKISVQSSGASFFDCVNTSGTHWYCIIGPEVGISEFDELKVIALGN